MSGEASQDDIGAISRRLKDSDGGGFPPSSDRSGVTAEIVPEDADGLLDLDGDAFPPTGDKSGDPSPECGT